MSAFNEPDADPAPLRRIQGGDERQAMTTYPMSPGDAAWFHMDGPANLAIMNGLLITRQALDFSRVRATYRERLLGFERFRQRVVEVGLPFATPHWQDMPNFDIDQHLHHIALVAPNDQSALRTLVSDIASTPLDHSQPLWQVYVVDDVEDGSALIMRVHHCIADGTGMMTVIGKLFDTKPGTPILPDTPADATPAEHPPGDGLLAPAIKAIERTVRSAMAMAGGTVAVVMHPRQALDKATTILGGTGMLVSELLKTNDPQSPLKGEFGPHKKVAWSRPVPIEEIKAIGARYGAKVNDVLVAAMTGALRSYLKGHGVDVNHTTLRAMGPVDLRPPERLGQLGNEFGLVILDLAITSAGPVQRLAITKARMDALKRSPEPVATLMLMEILGRAPKALEDFSNVLFGRKASLVMSNVVGPREVLYLAGVPIDRMISWAPHPGQELGMTITILSYRGFATLSVIGDARLVPDPQTISDQFQHEFQSLLRRATARTDRAPAQRVQAKPAPARRRSP